MEAIFGKGSCFIPLMFTLWLILTLLVIALHSKLPRFLLLLNRPRLEEK